LFDIEAGVWSMTLANGLALVILIGATAAQAETAPSPASDSGTVHRLTEAEKDALFDRIAQRQLAEPSQPAAETRPSKAEKVGLGILSYLGSAAADAAVDRRCGGSLQCRTGDSTIASANGRVTP
jgi:hypothetical protein